MKRSNFVKGAFIILTFWCVVWTLLTYIPLVGKRNIKFPQSEVRDILFENFPTYYELANVEGSAAFKGCKKQCRLTLNTSKRPEADAIVVFSHEHIMPGYQYTLSKPSHQKWVFFAVESPPYSGHNKLAGPQFQNKFDLMMSYRKDSDISFGYIKTEKKVIPATQMERQADLKMLKESFAKKKKMVAWFVSHCSTQSQRMKYVEELRKHIQVDVYGACGSLKCDNRTLCDQMVADDYKFYLSFENTLCKDYVSEKLLRILSLRTTVPVVRGSADYSKVCPPNSVVNTADFASPAKLAENLKQLASNETEYIKKLEWGWEYKVSSPLLPMCELCDKVHEVKVVKAPYADAAKWWQDGICHAPTDI